MEFVVGRLGGPVNLLVLEGEGYPASPRGETQWVRNPHVAGEGRPKLGRGVRGFGATEVPNDEKPPILRAYPDRWAGETRGLFDAQPGAPEEEFLRVAPDRPVFRLGLR